MEIKKKLSFCIERIDLKEFICYYQYKFSTNQWLENIDNYKYFGIEHNATKQIVIDSLVEEFRISLNSVVFGDPAGREYMEHLENLPKKNKID